MQSHISGVFGTSVFRSSVIGGAASWFLIVLVAAALFPDPAFAQHPFKRCINVDPDPSDISSMTVNQCYVETKVCNRGEIDVYAFVAIPGKTASSTHKSFGWYDIKRNKCQLISYQWSFGLAFMASEGGSSIILDKDKGEITYNYGRGDKTKGNDWQNSPGFVCVPEGASGPFETSFQTWDYDAACKKDFMRFPLSNWVTPYERKRWNRGTLKIKPKRPDPNRVQVLELDDGERYVGQMRNGLRNGRGVCTWPNGDHYDGEWKDNIKTGHGVYTWSDGDKYVGQWKDDMINGRGEMVFNTGNKYNGEWKKYMQTGRGVATLANGDTCEGEWRKHKLVGTGAGKQNGVAKPCYPQNNIFTFRRS